MWCHSEGPLQTEKMGQQEQQQAQQREEQNPTPREDYPQALVYAGVWLAGQQFCRKRADGADG